MTKTKKRKTEDNPQLRQELRQFFGGSEQRYQHALHSQVIYSEGVRHLAESAEAFWLLDVIAYFLATGVAERASKFDSRIASLHFWRLEVYEDDSALVTARADSDLKPFVSESVRFTDFSLPSIEIWAGYDGVRWVLYLPVEH